MAETLLPLDASIWRNADQTREAAQGRQRETGFFTPGMRVVLSAVPGLTKKGLLDDTPFYFQVPPLDSVSIGYAADHTEYTTIAGETLSRPGALALRVVSFQT